MRNSGCHKVRRAAAYQRVSVMRLYAFICVFMLATAAAHTASCDDHFKSANAVEREDGRALMNPHDAAGGRPQCSSCHTAKPPALNFDAVTTCVKCHSGNIDNHPVSRHPIGVAPRIRVPSFLPLTADGKMVCYTCHDPHKNLKEEPKKMLRVGYEALCASCHVGY